MIKLSNFFRTLDRMKKYGYMKESAFYKTASSYKRQYKRAKTRSEKRLIHGMIEGLVESNPSLSKIPTFKKRVKRLVDSVNARYGSGEELLNYENINDYIDYIDKVSEFYGNYFYDTEKVLNNYKDIVIMGGESVETAFKRLLT